MCDSEPLLWPTPITGGNRKSRKAMTASKDNGRRSGGGNSSPPGLAQAVELAAGVMPKELEGMPLEDMSPEVRRWVEMLTVGSLFAGIGGFDLGLERTGHMQTLWFCEQDAYCQRVLAKHWPGVPCYPDVRALVADTADHEPQEPQGDDGEHGQRTAQRRGQLVAAGPRASSRTRRGTDTEGTPRRGRTKPGAARLDGDAVPVPVPSVDVLAGGFPCQDLSYAGRGAGITGERSGLWAEYARLIRDLRPRYVIVENVPALLARGMDRVLGDLAALGYDAEWDCIPASAVGAPHRRDRVWIVACPNGKDEPHGAVDAKAPGHAPTTGRGARRPGRPDPTGTRQREPVRSLQDMADAEGEPVGAGLRSHGPGGERGRRPRDVSGPGHAWATEPDVGRVAHGIPNRVDRLAALGNSLVPQIAEWIGRRVVEWEAANAADAA